MVSTNKLWKQRNLKECCYFNIRLNETIEYLKSMAKFCLIEEDTLKSIYDILYDKKIEYMNKVFKEYYKFRCVIKFLDGEGFVIEDDTVKIYINRIPKIEIREIEPKEYKIKLDYINKTCNEYLEAFKEVYLDINKRIG